MNTMDLDRTYIAETYRRFPIELTEGHGSILKDAQGREYIDLGSGIAVNIFGMNDEIWKQAVIAQINQVQHASNLYYTAPQAKLAEQLCLRTGMKRAFFANSGAEANECVIKTMRKYASDQYGEGKRPTIITLVNSFHGRTITTLSATGQDVFHRHFGPFTPGFVHVPANDFEAMQRAIEENAVCGIMMEMIQGEGGVLPLNVDFVQRTGNYARRGTYSLRWTRCRRATATRARCTPTNSLAFSRTFSPPPRASAAACPSAFACWDRR